MDSLHDSTAPQLCVVYFVKVVSLHYDWDVLFIRGTSDVDPVSRESEFASALDVTRWFHAIQLS